MTSLFYHAILENSMKDLKIGKKAIQVRRADREVKDVNEMIRIMKQCDVCRLALNDEGYPYILPLNFGVKVQEGKVTLYFHGAEKGKKYELIKKDSRASFEMDCSHRLVSSEEKGYCTMEYESVIGRGKVEIVSEEEKMEALTIMTDHYHETHFDFHTKAVPRTTAMKLVVEEMTGKRRVKGEH